MKYKVKCTAFAVLAASIILTACGGGGGGGGNAGPDPGGDAENWVQDAYLKPSNTDSADVFGNAVAVDGDTMVVAAPWESGNQTTITNDDGVAGADNSASHAGAVYVFRKDGSGNWIQDAYLKASNAGAGDEFGTAVAISGDIIVVGAYHESSNQTTVTNDDGTASTDNSASSSGAVYVFKKDGSGNWIQDAYLKASNAGANDCFGCSVAVNGDTIVVGAYGESSNQTTVTNDDGTASTNNSASLSGAVYVFKKDGSGNWIQDAYLKASNSGANDYFGCSIAVNGDTIVVGACGESSNQAVITNGDGAASNDNSASSSGAAYVFRKDGSGNWIQDAYLKASNTGSSDGFGFSVATNGDIIVVGASTESSNQTTITNDDGIASADNSAPNAGAVYVFKKDGFGNWIQDAYLKASNTAGEAEFGWSVAVSSDVIVIGAVYENSNRTGITNDDGNASADTSAVYAGAVYVFKKDGSGNWIQDAYLKASNNEASDCFGTSVAISDDTVIAGSFGEDSSQVIITNDDGSASSDNSVNACGAAYVFTLK